jgi:hypothetical protein
MNNEPVAWINRDEKEGWLNWDKNTNMPINIPLYPHPSEHDLGVAEAIGFDKGYKAATAKTLTDEEITDIASTLLIATDSIEYEWGVCVTEFARAILRKAQEK